MMIKGWKFTTREGLILDETTNYPEDIKQMMKDMSLADNALSLAKVSIYSDDLHDVQFHWNDAVIDVPTEHIISFNPFIRATCDGMSGKVDEKGEMFYLLNGQEYPLKKKIMLGKDLKILSLLQKSNTV